MSEAVVVIVAMVLVTLVLGWVVRPNPVPTKSEFRSELITVLRRIAASLEQASTRQQALATDEEQGR